MNGLEVSRVPHLFVCNDLIFDEKVENSRELAHREPVVGRKLTHILAVMDYRQSAGLMSHLRGEKERSVTVRSVYMHNIVFVLLSKTATRLYFMKSSH